MVFILLYPIKYGTFANYLKIKKVQKIIIKQKWD